MSLGYEKESSHVVDYELYSLPGVSFTLRGPQWPLEGNTPQVSFIGAAQTFGTFSKYPFPNLLGDMVSTRVLNLGTGGAGPGTYLTKPRLLELVNASSLCVVQVMSGRASVRNSHMAAIGGSSTVEFRGKQVSAIDAFRTLAEELPRDEFYRVIQETRQGFVEKYTELAEAITVPKVLLYVGPNPPLKDFAIDDDWKRHDLMGVHPHLVNRGTIEMITGAFDQYVEVHETEGTNSKLMNRYTGEYCEIKRSEKYTVRTHSAYISPRLHAMAALALFEPVRKILSAWPSTAC